MSTILQKSCLKNWRNRSSKSFGVWDTDTKIKALLSIHLNVLVCCCCLVAKLCPTLCNPTDYTATRFLCPWDCLAKNTGVGLTISFSRGFSRPRDQTSVYIGRWILYHWATREASPTFALQFYNSKSNFTTSALFKVWYWLKKKSEVLLLPFNRSENRS